MTNKIIFVQWACFILLSKFSLASHSPLGAVAELEKRNSWRSMFGLPSQDGNKPGTGPPPAQLPSQSRPTNGNSDSSPAQGGSFGPSNNGPNSATSGSDTKQWLDQHNKWRAQYKATPLKWSESLVAASKRLTDACVWKHTPNNRYGENMAAGQPSIQEVVTGWVAGPNERDIFKGANSKPTHFTQVVWLATTELGCFKTTCRNVRGLNLPQSPVVFWACSYNPPGNVIGQIGQNVKAAPGGRPL
ncbi:hypothetical protein Pst134EA_025484 [Puccinia striiformis f. sp. tritici]|uniref:SCP domain-containing protein n=2 Tax=Puccinia striiformis TaxID=27350 RepID=A0A0L0W0T8_9BASI|nr:hypothetical protein Pst134EA_025484 [Puccinia striiformis f. sp. tritici]KAH9443722.1 hypothetical protein Pst134EB_026119 [Puccinia striiformis f. sp. tritici]KAH9451533.1 hypothetical protein Pst134EA_025484 [Puccinia striiformis f. sp. tritici]KAI9613036.1 hypothetical protein H4Q26_010308 [Puccinia striiformis f. sp. tritici PST-130]KNF05109.1 hypothetical protein PSTG_01738 [Puccinia striiformis f. sp. tritici PST-78]